MSSAVCTVHTAGTSAAAGGGAGGHFVWHLLPLVSQSPVVTYYKCATLQARTARAVTALQRAAAIGQDAVAQVPLEAIVNNSVDGLQVLRSTIEQPSCRGC